MAVSSPPATGVKTIFVFGLGVMAFATGLIAAAPTAAKPALPSAASDQEEPPIPGIVIQRTTGDGRQLGLTMVKDAFRLSFYDQKRKPIAVDVDRARLHWQPKNSPLTTQAILNPVEGGKALGNTNHIQRPYGFVVWIVLLKGKEFEDEVAEKYSVYVNDAALQAK